MAAKTQEYHQIKNYKKDEVIVYVQENQKQG